MAETRAVIKIRAQPRAARAELAGWQGDTLRARVTAAPEGGKANEAIIELTAAALGIAKSRVTIVRGHAARDKALSIEGMTQAEAMRRLGGPLPNEG